MSLSLTLRKISYHVVSCSVKSPTLERTDGSPYLIVNKGTETLSL